MEDRNDMVNNWADYMEAWEQEYEGYSSTIRSVSEKLLNDKLNAEAIFEVGIVLLKENQIKKATDFLYAAHHFDPDKPGYLIELASALEMSGEYDLAISLIQSNMDLAYQDPMLHYLLALHAVYSERIELSRSQLEIIESIDDAPFRFYSERIRRMLGRYDYLHPYQEQLSHMRFWYFVTTGGILLDSPNIQGYYKSRDLENQDLYEILKRLDLSFSKMSLSFTSIAAIPEKSSMIMAKAWRMWKDLPMQEFKEKKKDVLVCSYDLIDVIPEYRKQAMLPNENNFLFSVGAGMGNDIDVAPDFLGFFYRESISPWGPGFTSKLEHRDLTHADDEELASRIIDSKTEIRNANDLKEFIDLLLNIPDRQLIAAFQDKNQRERLWIRKPDPVK
ncbi:tetratricopeptide repeat protein [Portibacter marinus]|uniref:tetratricopeptide repeat protein n=1 Tax=Portibacter marinus TaxID=2898660 RepID=UPI001F24F697|nr:tetratricopeptide repeat protein [Portibacter marinus]